MSQDTKTILVDPLIDNNPITLQILGVCSALAVTSSLRPALLMAISVIGVLAFANVAISLMRHRRFDLCEPEASDTTEVPSSGNAQRTDDSGSPEESSDNTKPGAPGSLRRTP